MHKKFEVNRTKIKGGCQSYTKAAPQQSWSDLTLVENKMQKIRSDPEAWMAGHAIFY